MSSAPAIVQKVALVTGASRGLGRLLAGHHGSGHKGIRPLSPARREDRAEARELVYPDLRSAQCPRGSGPSGRHRPTRSPCDRLRLLAAAKRHGRIDLLVNNASDLGDTPLPPLVNASRDTFLRVFDVNTLAPLAIVREALPLLTRVRGLVVNITSDAALGGYPGWGVYGASKAALELVSKTLAAELKDRDVAVVSVDPGDMRTRMHQDAYLGQDISDRPLPDVTLPFWAWLLSQPPMKVSGMRYQAQAAVWEVAA